MKKSSQIILFFILLLAIFLLFVANLYLPRVYELLFPLPEKTGELSVSPALVNDTENIYKVDIKFKSGNDIDIAKPVGAVSFSLSYPKDNNVPVDIVDENGVLTESVQIGPVISSDQWEVPINRIVNSDEGIEIQFVAINNTPTGFTTSNFVTLGSIYFKSDKPINEDIFVLTFNTDKSAIVSKLKPADNILDQDANLYYSVE